MIGGEINKCTQYLIKSATESVWGAKSNAFESVI